MAKRMSDDEVNDYVYRKIFGDLDGIEADSLFDKNDAGLEGGVADNAEPNSDNSGGIEITVKPLMKGAIEGGKKTDTNRDGAAEEDDDEDDEDDKLAGISGMSPLMAQLHGKR